MVLLIEGAEIRPHQWQLTVTAGAMAHHAVSSKHTQSDLEAKREGSHNGVRVRRGTQFLAKHTLNHCLGVSIRSMGVPDGNTPEVDPTTSAG